jgi:hypothetical protein
LNSFIEGHAQDSWSFHFQHYGELLSGIASRSGSRWKCRDRNRRCSARVPGPRTIGRLYSSSLQSLAENLPHPGAGINRGDFGGHQQHASATTKFVDLCPNGFAYCSWLRPISCEIGATGTTDDVGQTSRTRVTELEQPVFAWK